MQPRSRALGSIRATTTLSPRATLVRRKDGVFGRPLACRANHVCLALLLQPRAPRCVPPAIAGALLWIYRDSLEADGVTVSVPKAKLDKIQSELSAIKELLGQ